MSAEMRANTIPNLLKKMIAHVATSAVFVHSVHFVHVKCIKVYEATVSSMDDTATDPITFTARGSVLLITWTW